MISNVFPRGMLAMLLLTVSSGCATTGEVAEKEVALKAKTFATTSGESSIYICRDNQYFGSAVLIRVTLDGQSIATLGPGNFVMKNVSPGTHKIWTEMGGVTPPIPAETQLKTVSGQCYFVRAALVADNFTTNKIEQTELATDAGEKQVSRYRMVKWQRE